jgi:hypothetical protein
LDLRLHIAQYATHFSLETPLGRLAVGLNPSKVCQWCPLNGSRGLADGGFGRTVARELGHERAWMDADTAN